MPLCYSSSGDVQNKISLCRSSVTHHVAPVCFWPLKKKDCWCTFTCWLTVRLTRTHKSKWNVAMNRCVYRTSWGRTVVRNSLVCPRTLTHSPLSKYGGGGMAAQYSYWCLTRYLTFSRSHQWIMSVNLTLNLRGCIMPMTNYCAIIQQLWVSRSWKLLYVQF